MVKSEAPAVPATAPRATSVVLRRAFGCAATRGAYFDTRGPDRVRQSPDYVSTRGVARAATADWARPGRQSARGAPDTDL